MEVIPNISGRERKLCCEKYYDFGVLGQVQRKEAH